jgi:hypothetical protein
MIYERLSGREAKERDLAQILGLSLPLLGGPKTDTV